MTSSVEYPQTDHGNALRFADAAKGKMLWTPAHGWLRWAGGVWTPTQTDDAALQLARRVAVGVAAEALALPDQPPPGAKVSAQESRLRWCEQSQSVTRLRAMVDVARGSKWIAERSDVFDAEIGKINTPAGVLSLASGELAKHAPSQRYIKQTAAAPMSREDYASSLLGSTWYRFLHWAMCGNHQLIDYLQAAVGASLVGDGRCQQVFFCHGGGGNGKGAFERALRYALQGYCHALPRAFLEVRRGIAPASDEYNLANMQGARMCIGSEVGKHAAWDEGKVKQLSGGDIITGRHPYGRPFDIKPTWVLWVLGNDKPSVEGTDASMWRRLRLIPWLASVEDTADADKLPPDFEDQLQVEAPLILRWAQDGAAQWSQSRTLPPCDAVDNATDEYREAEDVIGRALEEIVTVTEKDDDRVKCVELTTAITEWCKARSISWRGMDRKLSDYMPRLGARKIKSGGVMVWAGVKMLADAQSKPDGGSRWPTF
jgi:P4 family phage/plasmid primase-like protien